MILLQWNNMFLLTLHQLTDIWFQTALKQEYEMSTGLKLLASKSGANPWTSELCVTVFSTAVQVQPFSATLPPVSIHEKMRGSWNIKAILKGGCGAF